MSDTNPSTPQVNKRGLSFSWSLVLKIMAWISPLILAGALSWAEARFASHEEVAAVDNRLTTHATDNAVRMKSLEDFQLRETSDSANVAITLKTIGEDQAAQKAVLVDVKNTMERVLNRLDTINDRQLHNADKAAFNGGGGTSSGN